MKNVKTNLFKFFKDGFHVWHKTEKALGFWFVVLRGFLNKLSKPSKHQRHNLYVRARLKPGWVRWVFHFTFEWLWIFPAQTCQFSRPYFPETLDASREEGFYFFFLDPRAYPSAVWRLNGIALSPLLQRKKVCSDWCQPLELFICVSCFFVPAFIFREDKKNFLEKNFLSVDQVSERKHLVIWSRTTMRTCDIFYIYTCVLLSDNIRTIRLQVIRWKLPTQPVSSRNK
jgi:hypothetical protein